MFFKERAAASERCHCATAPEKMLRKNVQLIFFYVGDCITASGNVSMFFKERATASGRCQCATASERLLLKEICNCFLELCPLKK